MVFIQKDLEAPMAKPMPIVLKETVVPIVEEPSLQEDMAFEPEVSLIAAEPEVPIIEESIS